MPVDDVAVADRVDSVERVIRRIRPRRHHPAFSIIVVVGLGVGSAFASLGMLAMGLLVRLFGQGQPSTVKVMIVGVGAVAAACVAGWLTQPSLSRLVLRVLRGGAYREHPAHIASYEGGRAAKRGDAPEEYQVH